MAIDVVPLEKPQYLPVAEVKRIQAYLDVLLRQQEIEFAELHQQQQQEIEELKMKQAAERIEYYRDNPDAAFAKAAGLVRTKI